MIEDYGRFLKKKAKSDSLRRARARSSRSPLRFWTASTCARPSATGIRRKIYVRQLDKVAGEVGAVVVIFDEDRDDRYQYLTTWLGEHQNESDMAFYSTHPFEHLVGPGIGRAEYGGFLMTLPPRRMFDVWSDPDYDFALNQAGTAVDGRAGLFGAAHRGVCGREAAALDFPVDRGASESANRLHSDRRALAHQAEEAARGACAR